MSTARRAPGPQRAGQQARQRARQPAKRPAGRGPRSGRLRAVTRDAARGDRPYVLGLVAMLVLVGAMALGPLQNYTAAADRVEGLERVRDQLQQEVDTLEERRERLEDPEEVETMARTLGLVKPGEIPFVVVSPDEELPQIGPGPADDGPARDVPWYHRLGRWLGDLVDAGGG